MYLSHVVFLQADVMWHLKIKCTFKAYFLFMLLFIAILYDQTLHKLLIFWGMKLDQVILKTNITTSKIIMWNLKNVITGHHKNNQTFKNNKLKISWNLWTKSSRLFLLKSGDFQW